MTPHPKQECDGCPRIFTKRSLVKWKGKFYCKNCRAKNPSYKIMYIGVKRTEEEIDEMEGRG